MKSESLLKKNDFEDEELNKLEELGKKHYGSFASKFSHLKNEIIEAKDFTSEKKPAPFDVLQKKIEETINKWKDSTSQGDKNKIILTSFRTILV